MAGGEGKRLGGAQHGLPVKPLRVAGAGHFNLLQQTAQRQFPGSQLWVSCQASQQPDYASALGVVDCNPQRWVMEPCSRNTAAALALVAAQAPERALLWVMPADHWIEDTARLHEAVAQALNLARLGLLVCFGIPPTHPCSDYGYIRTGAVLSAHAHAIERFEEKPSANRAAALMQEAGCFWNSGMFVLPVRRLRRAYAELQPGMWACVQQLASAHTPTERAVAARAFAQLPAEPFDRVILEHWPDCAVVPLHTGWSDLGTPERFDALSRLA